MKLTVEPAPKPSETNYRYFRDETDQLWKAKLEIRQNRPPLVDAEVELATTQWSAHVSVSPVDEAGRALRDDDGRPIVIDADGHTFTAVEQTSSDYDPEARIMALVEGRIAEGQVRLAANARLHAVVAGWSAPHK